nr:4'-phosphopantetheinyl transferase superfamily protein [uncultured Rhodopila sp.]
MTPFCSLSHSGDMVACGLARIGRIGIDIERIRIGRRILAISQAAFGPAERAAVEFGGAETFYRVWTLREALAKASGAGSGLLVDRVDEIPVLSDIRPADQSPYRFRYWRLPEHYGLGVALACPPAEMADLTPIGLS